MQAWCAPDLRVPLDRSLWGVSMYKLTCICWTQPTLERRAAWQLACTVTTAKMCCTQHDLLIWRPPSPPASHPALLLSHTELALGAEFQKCSKRAQNRNSSRKKTSMLNMRLNDYRQIYFDKEDRKRIPEAVIEEIRWGRPEQGYKGLTGLSQGVHGKLLVHTRPSGPLAVIEDVSGGLTMCWRAVASAKWKLAH